MREAYYYFIINLHKMGELIYLKEVIMSKSLLLGVAILGIIFLSGCHQKGCIIKPQDLNKVTIGMTKEELVDQIGEPAVYIKGNPNFCKIDAWVYPVLGRAKQYWYGLMYLCSFGFYEPDMNINCCLVSFSDEKLSKWCVTNGWTNYFQ